MKKVQVRELQKILQDHVQTLKHVRLQNVRKAIDSGDLQNSNYKEFISDTDKRISKAENILSSIEGEFNLVDETEEEEEEC
tara:strand:- start:255 stop:497 length:243 start_codon:yes stop_codon:yes gene_type:complete